MVMVTTWVASQKFESSTARIISMVSPVPERWCATMSEAKPAEAATAVAKPRRYIRSITTPSSTAAHPTNTADE
jgi:hypothetical protein